MENYEMIPTAAVISAGRLANGQRYIVYLTENGSVSVCAEYTRKGGSYTVCTRYVRRLCGSAKELMTLGKPAIEDTAYGAFMDGAAQGR